MAPSRTFILVQYGLYFTCLIELLSQDNHWIQIGQLLRTVTNAFFHLYQIILFWYKYPILLIVILFLVYTCIYF